MVCSFRKKAIFVFSSGAVSRALGGNRSRLLPSLWRPKKAYQGQFLSLANFCSQKLGAILAPNFYCSRLRCGLSFMSSKRRIVRGDPFADPAKKRAANASPATAPSPASAYNRKTAPSLDDLQALEKELLEREARVTAREKELKENEERAGARPPPSVAPPPFAPSAVAAPPPPPPTAPAAIAPAVFSIAQKLLDRVKLTEEHDAKLSGERKEFLKRKGRSYEHVQEGRLLLLVKELYSGHIERFLALFNFMVLRNSRAEEARAPVMYPNINDVLEVARFVSELKNKLTAEDFGHFSNAFRVRVCSPERMKKVRLWLEANPLDDYITDDMEEFATRITELFYTKLTDPETDPPPASVFDGLLSSTLVGSTTTDPLTRRNVALDEKIIFWRQYDTAKDRPLFLVSAHKHRRDVNAGEALAKLKAAFQKAYNNNNSSISFFSFFSADHSMNSVITVAQVASKLKEGELANFVRYVDSRYKMDQLAKTLTQQRRAGQVGGDAIHEALVGVMREQLGTLERQWKREQLVRTMRRAGMPEDPLPTIDKCQEHLPQFVEIIRLLGDEEESNAEARRTAMRKAMESLLMSLRELKHELPLENRRSQNTLGEESIRRPYGSRYNAWAMALAYFVMFKQGIVALGVTEEMHKQIEEFEILQAHRSRKK